MYVEGNMPTIWPVYSYLFQSLLFTFGWVEIYRPSAGNISCLLLIVWSVTLLFLYLTINCVVSYLAISLLCFYCVAVIQGTCIVYLRTKSFSLKKSHLVNEIILIINTNPGYQIQIHRALPKDGEDAQAPDIHPKQV